MKQREQDRRRAADPTENFGETGGGNETKRGLRNDRGPIEKGNRPDGTTTEGEPAQLVVNLDLDPDAYEEELIEYLEQVE